MKQTRVVSTKCTPGFACRAFSDTTLVCFIVNERTTKCSRYIDVPRIFLPRFVTQIFDAGKNLLPWAIMCVCTGLPLTFYCKLQGRCESWLPLTMTWLPPLCTMKYNRSVGNNPFWFSSDAWPLKTWTHKQWKMSRTQWVFEWPNSGNVSHKP